MLQRHADLIVHSPSFAIGDFLQCADCGQVVVERMPPDDALAAYYQSYPSSPSYAAKAQKKILRARRRIRRLRRLVPSGRFLDIGCNLGFAVEAARQLGFAATGIEVDTDAVATARRQFPECEFEAATAGAFAETGRDFDLLYCAEVIEHLSRVRPFAAALARLVRPGGVLYLTTPDAGHWAVPRDFVSWNEVKPPEHLRWFTKRALGRLFGDAGFEIARFKWSLKPGIRMIAIRRQRAP